MAINLILPEFYTGTTSSNWNNPFLLQYLILRLWNNNCNCNLVLMTPGDEFVTAFCNATATGD